MERYEVVVSLAFQHDLRNIVGYIRYQLSAPVAAEEFLNSLEKTLEDLQRMPYRHALVTDLYLQHQGFRTCRVKNYLVFYKVDQSAQIVQIHRLLHTMQNWNQLL